MLRYKIDVLTVLKDAGYTTYRLSKENIFGHGTIQKFRNGEIVSAENLDKLCKLLQCQPADILEYVEENNNQ